MVSVACTAGDVQTTSSSIPLSRLPLTFRSSPFGCPHYPSSSSFSSHLSYFLPNSPFSQFLFFRDDLKASNFLCGVSVVITVLFELPLFALSERVLAKCGTRGLITVSHLAYVNGVNMSMLYWFRGSLSRVYVYVCVCVVHI